MPASECCPGQRKGVVSRVYFISAHPVRLQSGMRLFQLCRPRLFHVPLPTGKTKSAITRLVRAPCNQYEISRCFSCAHSVSGGKQSQMAWQHPNTSWGGTLLSGRIGFHQRHVLQKGIHLSADSRQRLCSVLLPELHSGQGNTELTGQLRLCVASCHAPCANLLTEGCRRRRKGLSEQKRLALRALNGVNRPVANSQQRHRALVAIMASRGPGRCAWVVRRLHAL